MKSVYILGNGQLGRMLRQAGEPLGIAVYPIGVDALPDQISYQQSVITAEIERWPDTPFTQMLATHPLFVNRDVFPIIADRLTQKALLDELSLPTAKWSALNDDAQWPALFQSLGDLLIIKRRVGGYDGRGQWRLGKDKAIDLPLEIYTQAIVEQAIAFEGEISLVGARNRQGQTVFYPITHNYHQEGILKASIAHPYLADRFQLQAEKRLTTIMDRLNYVGVMAMECFIVGESLLINELAPRVHNSGHWTQNGASISQFELHLRAILDMPLPKPVVSSSSLMINLIGIPLNYQWLQQPLVHLHWYDKAVRAGRKVGHLNLCHPDPNQLSQVLITLLPLLPSLSQDVIQWANRRLV
ncbi:5-(carboxyamino)imidazole ribonucleotide synthase [Utexia brackfieldae]|uniref:5-(carboxyamino)imidazole ribonucleotide synthase n=1 Tax=Utexia brackfieldae TaxID=3074108 RepID=UPI00370CFE18